MDESGFISGLLLTKLAVAVAVIAIIGSALVFHERLDRTTREEKLERTLGIIVSTIRTADSLPGTVRLTRDLPSIEGNYELFVSCEFRTRRLIEVSIGGSKNLNQHLFLSRSVSRSLIRKEDPQRISITKSDKIYFEVM